MAYSWGYNGFGQLGDATTSNKNVPSWIPYLSNPGNLSAGSNHSFNLSSGEASAWGYNLYGQLGLGHNTDMHWSEPIGPIY